VEDEFVNLFSNSSSLEALFSEFKHTQFQDWKTQLLKDLKKDSVDNLLTTRIEELDVPVYLESENAPVSQSISSLRKAHHPEFEQIIY
jgi:hypothetical protein